MQNSLNLKQASNGLAVFEFCLGVVKNYADDFAARGVRNTGALSVEATAYTGGLELKIRAERAEGETLITIYGDVVESEAFNGKSVVISRNMISFRVHYCVDTSELHFLKDDSVSVPVLTGRELQRLA